MISPKMAQRDVKGRHHCAAGWPLAPGDDCGGFSKGFLIRGMTAFRYDHSRMKLFVAIANESRQESLVRPANECLSNKAAQPTYPKNISSRTPRLREIANAFRAPGSEKGV
jgi:hypothetical protein